MNYKSLLQSLKIVKNIVKIFLIVFMEMDISCYMKIFILQFLMSPYIQLVSKIVCSRFAYYMHFIGQMKRVIGRE